MRISDWSSDVCSSDLGGDAGPSSEGVLAGSVGSLGGTRGSSAPGSPGTARRRFAGVVFGLAGAVGAVGVGGSGGVGTAIRMGALLRSSNASPMEDRKRTRLYSIHSCASRLPSYA